MTLFPWYCTRACLSSKDALWDRFYNDCVDSAYLTISYFTSCGYRSGVPFSLLLLAWDVTAECAATSTRRLLQSVDLNACSLYPEMATSGDMGYVRSSNAISCDQLARTESTNKWSLQYSAVLQYVAVLRSVWCCFTAWCCFTVCCCFTVSMVLFYSMVLFCNTVLCFVPFVEGLFILKHVQEPLLSLLAMYVNSHCQWMNWCW